ncbi:DNA damage-regulated autophagy modulator protein 1-like [Haliotis rufescens]|uniref:DNA damage-regulated autophagy modulator protein 1-like n=1 Tax=Haliotis rufescens TaxID=6454 RepID=UPI00201E8A59|nr:DNA damage-regulated autophagy modulator protein 1-like [Haliotis rufescens]
MYSALGFLPIALVLLAAGTFVVSYVIAVVRGDVTAAFPYISDTGAKIPESSVFGQFLNLAAFISFCTMYIRYKMIDAISTGEDRWLVRMNRFTMVMGIISSLGCSMVANFQEGTEVEAVHISGAFLVFVGGVIYTFLQAGISYHMYPDYNGLRICRIRLTICLTSLTCLIITLAAAGVALYKWNAVPHTKTKLKWDEGDPGFTAHIVSTIGEWLTAFTFLSFFFTYVRDFQKFRLTITTHPLVRHLDEEPYLDQTPNERTHLLA